MMLHPYVCVCVCLCDSLRYVEIKFHKALVASLYIIFVNILILLQDLPFSLARIVISAGNIHECILGGREASSPDLRGLSMPSLTFNGFKA